MFYNTKIKVFKDSRYFLNHLEFPNTVVKFRNLGTLTQIYQKKILVSQNERESTVINISILEEDQAKGIAFLNKLTENYIINEVNEKKIVSKNTVSFISLQLKEFFIRS